MSVMDKKTLKAIHTLSEKEIEDVVLNSLRRCVEETNKQMPEYHIQFEGKVTVTTLKTLQEIDAMDLLTYYNPPKDKP